MSTSTDRFQKIIISIAAVILALTVLQNFLYMKNNQIPTVIILILVLIFCAIIYKVKISTTKLLISILSLSFILRFAFIIFVPQATKSDFGFMYDAAKTISQTGEFFSLDNRYFHDWAYQTPFVLYEALILKISNSTFVLEFLNVCYMVGTNILIYLTAKKLVSTRAALTVAFLYAVYPEPILMSSVLTNQHISTFLIYSGIYLIIRKCNLKTFLLAGILLGLGNIMRPEAIIVIATLTFVSAVLFFKYIKTREKFEVLKNIAVLLVAYFIVTSSANLIIQLSNINKYGTSNQFPEWKLVVGFNQRTFGEYSRDDITLFEIQNYEQRKKAALKIFEESVKNHDMLNFFVNKTNKMWAKGESSVYAIHRNELYQKFLPNSNVTKLEVINGIVLYDKSVYILLLLAFLLSCVMLVFNKAKFSNKQFIFIVLFLADYFIYLIIEISVRYRYFIMPAIFISAAVAMLLFEKLEVRKTFDKISYKLNKKGK